jgi:hypothetical protein
MQRCNTDSSRLSGVKMNVHWLVPWMPIESGKTRSTFEAELCCELSAGHPLHGLLVTAIARRKDQDDVLFMLSDGRVAEVHLTWRRQPEVDGLPRTLIYPTVEAWTEHRMMRHHEEFGDDC